MTGMGMKTYDTEGKDTTRFATGSIVMTKGLELLFAASLNRKADNPIRFLYRHVNGDWGDVPAEDAAANDDALTSGNRIMSAYRMADGTPFWIITEADRSVTTLLLPEEY